MNERLRELAEQATTEESDGFRYFDKEKFAELIIRECAAFMYNNFPNTHYETGYMRKHMGDPDWSKPL